MLRAGVAAADPFALLHSALRTHPIDSGGGVIRVVAAGKAARPMAAALLECVPVRSGVVAALEVPARMGPLECHVAGHPRPDDGSVAAARRALSLAGETAPGDLLVVLLSGGASALLAEPAPGISTADKGHVIGALMTAGGAIDEVNCVRKHLSTIKGGRLAARAARAITFALSDVHGPTADDPAVIGSGPTVADPTTFRDALAILRDRAVEVPLPVMHHLAHGAEGSVEETPKPGDPRLASSSFVLIGNRHTALAGSADEAHRRGYLVCLVAAPTCGEAREAARGFVREALRIAAGATQAVCVLAAGETTVHVRGDGLGGRNQEFALAAATHLGGGARPVVLGSAGTDGIDGPTDAAGAVVDGTTLARAARAGLDPAVALARNDAYRFFDPLGDLIRWGPTGTNVGDLQVLLIGEGRSG